MKQRRLTEAEKLEICEMYNSSITSFKNIAEKFKVSPTAIREMLNRRGVYNKYPHGYMQRKYCIDESYFDNIDTQEKAYFLGILYADGCNQTDVNTVSLSLQEKDSDLLIKLNSFIYKNKPLRIKPNPNINHQTSLILTIHSKHISKRLEELGCGKAKTFSLVFPEWLNKDLYRHFIRGYFDGDGCIYNSKDPAFSLVGTEEFLLEVQKIMADEIGLSITKLSTRHKERNHNIRTLQYHGKNTCLLIREWLYKDSCIHMNRKYDKFKEIEKTVHITRLCTVEGCSNKHHVAGYCKYHHYHLAGGREKRIARGVIYRQNKRDQKNSTVSYL